MSSNWEEFYSKLPKPDNFNSEQQKIVDFVSKHSRNNKKIVLVTVRFIVYKILTQPGQKNVFNIFFFFSREVLQSL